MATPSIDTSTLATAVVEWVASLQLERPCHTPEDLSNPNLLYDVLTEVDPQWFKASRAGSGADANDNWVMKFNGLKKLYKLLIGYYEEVLGQPTGGLDVPNLTYIARDEDVAEMVKLAQLVVALAVQSENNGRYIQKIQALDQMSQHALMFAIENVMGRLTNPASAGRRLSEVGADLDDSNDALMYEKGELESKNKEMAEELNALRAENEKVNLANGALEQRMREMESTLSQLTEAGQVDFILRTEIDNLKAQLMKTESRRAEVEQQFEKQNSVITDLTRKYEEASNDAEEASRLKDALNEFRHMADKLQKSEAIVDKYKKRFEEVGDLRKQLKAAEEQAAQQAQRNVQLEEEFRKVAPIKPLVNTLKDQLSTLESRISSLQVENSTLEFQFTEARTKLERYEIERRNDHEHIQNLEDRLREAELRGPPISGTAATELGSDMSSVKVAQLEREVERLRNEKTSTQAIAEKVVALENMLEDANRLKAKYEKDYRFAFEKNLGLENELRQIRSMSDVDGRSQPFSPSTPTTPSHLTTELQAAHKQIQKLTEELRQTIGRLNKFSYERDRLQLELNDAQSAVTQQERVIGELRSDLAAMESRGQSSDENVQRIAAITKQAVDAQSKNDTLHAALKQAKEHIRRQEKSLKDYFALLPKDDNFTEAIASLQSTLSERDAELLKLKHELADTRAAARREQFLMASAWYSTITDSQIKASARLTVSGANNHNNARQQNGEKVNGGLAGGPPETPKSWLQRQRMQVLEQQQHLR
ncbi:HOOK protein-domain-containing protein [Fimicolochytrium jonesii]|uniref:HOOK protein-domain-containing protein n=1 Tax=Fimicolochytrium jonesii TaxID=1396493 RepID=UPI0022FEAE7E|nr:HOOK protein-domain-containing protein [Fimicolochytrium jonesii]KAI8819574.1 HOOK protein-domain-containing protein [Fimicolochytrium jonesii]